MNTNTHPTPSNMTLQMAVLAALAKPGAPRILDVPVLTDWLEQAKITPADRTLREIVRLLCTTGQLERVRYGVYLNRQAKPAVSAMELAPWLREGAVVSLQRVLSQAGVLNNPTPEITCVLDASLNRNVGVLDTALGTFSFHGLRPGLLPPPDADWAKDAFEPFTQVPMATPEKALLDWLALSQSQGGKSRLRPPAPQDIEWDGLDRERLDRLAQQMGLAPVLEAFERQSQQAHEEAAQAAARPSRRRGP